MHIRWDESAAATPHGKLVFFAEFLATTGVFERWVSSCPLEYRSGSAPDKRDVLRTLMPGLLAGHNGVDGYQHLRSLLVALRLAKTVDDYEALLPWNIAALKT